MGFCFEATLLMFLEDEQEIPVANVKYDTLVKIFEYCKHYLEDKMAEIEKPLKSSNLNEGRIFQLSSTSSDFLCLTPWLSG